MEIQPQLVLLQKTLLNIEGLGRDLDPELDLWATAKPFLEKWMIDQVGPGKFFSELKAQAPHYTKLLPELPLLLHNYLRNGTASTTTDSGNQIMAELLKEQRRTNSLLQKLLYGLMGFVVGTIAMQIFIRVFVV